MSSSTTGKTLGEVLRERQGLPQHFCIVPFTTIILQPNGNVGICRHKGTEFFIGNIRENTIDEVWNGPIARQWRKEFLAGAPEICAREVRERKCHLLPNWNTLLPHVEFKEELSAPILKLTANFNGKCNLRCKSCHVWMAPNGYYTEQNFWEPARKSIFPFIKEIDMLSGEPFIQKDTYKLIDEVSSLNPACKWNITTNAQWKFNHFVREKLDKIQIKSLSVSVDSLIPEMYAKLRTPGLLAPCLKTLDDIIEYRSHREALGEAFELSMNVCVQKENWAEADSMLDFCKKKGIHSFLFMIYEPKEISLLTLNESERRKIIEYYLETIASEKLNYLYRVLRALIYSLPKVDQAAYFLAWRNRVDQADIDEAMH